MTIDIYVPMFIVGGVICVLICMVFIYYFRE